MNHRNRSFLNFVSLFQVITTMSFRTSCFGIAHGARRKPKRHTGQDVQVFSSPPAAHALPVRRNDIFFSSNSSNMVVRCWTGLYIRTNVSWHEYTNRRPALHNRPKGENHSDLPPKQKPPIIWFEGFLGALLLKPAEREGFEPSIHFWCIHTFQACSFDHSDISPVRDGKSIQIFNLSLNLICN